MSEAERPDVIRAIGSFGRDAASAARILTEQLHDPSAQVRCAAEWSLSQIGPQAAAAVPELARALSDSNPHVRNLSAVALQAMGPKAASAVPQLIAALNDPVACVRAPAADALGAIGQEARTAVQPLAKKLGEKDEEVHVLRSVAAALGDMGPDAKAALPAPRKSLKMPRVIYTAQEAILKIEGRPVPTW